MAVTAYLLIQTEVGKAAFVVEAIRKIDGVVSADDVTGPYDVIVVTEADEHRRPRQAWSSPRSRPSTASPAPSPAPSSASSRTPQDFGVATSPLGDLTTPKRAG